MAASKAAEVLSTCPKIFGWRNTKQRHPLDDKLYVCEKGPRKRVTSELSPIICTLLVHPIRNEGRVFYNYRAVADMYRHCNSLLSESRPPARQYAAGNQDLLETDHALRDAGFGVRSLPEFDICLSVRGLIDNKKLQWLR